MNQSKMHHIDNKRPDLSSSRAKKCTSVLAGSLLAIALGGGLTLLSGCKTTEGLGKDIENLGEDISDAADD